MDKNIKTTIIVAVIVAIVTSLIMFFVVQQVMLAPRALYALDVADNSKACSADEVCEVNSLVSESGITGSLTASEIEVAQLTATDEVQLDVESSVKILRPDGFNWDLTKRYQDGQPTNDFAVYNKKNGVNSIVIHGSTDAVKVDNLKNSNTTNSAYVCVDFKGNLFRSQTPCV